ncbi:MAG TPA: hypothetical protein ENK13_04350 [Thermopetrobacter sp.]|nr:hypothetical protein [Thermopetrobacter sp.]
MRGILPCWQGRRDVNELLVDARVDPRRRPYYWLGFRRGAENPPADTDLHAIANRFVALTPLQMNLTHAAALARLAAALDRDGGS